MAATMMRLLVGLTLLLAGCSSTRFTTVWRDPGVRPEPFEKVFVVAVMPEEPVKRTAEDRLAAELAPAAATPEYAVITPQQRRDRRSAEVRVKELGFDAALVMRLSRVENEWAYYPAHWPAPYYTFWGYYDYAWPLAYEPAYLVADTVVVFETNLYRVSDGRLLWSGVSETFNPSSARELVGEVARAVGDALREQGFVAARDD
jgi:hypothetical protein